MIWWAIEPLLTCGRVMLSCILLKPSKALIVVEKNFISCSGEERFQVQNGIGVVTALSLTAGLGEAKRNLMVLYVNGIECRKLGESPRESAAAGRRDPGAGIAQGPSVTNLALIRLWFSDAPVVLCLFQIKFRSQHDHGTGKE